MNRLSAFAVVVVFLAVLPACVTVDPEVAARRAAMEAAIRAEAPGDYYIGRRFFKRDYKVWGWVRRPGQQWNTAKLVMFNEQQVLAPDRAQGKIGSDNNFEYTLRGRFSGDTIYEPASNGFYPEFILTGYELRSTSPALIFASPQAIQPEVRTLAAPM